MPIISPFICIDIFLLVHEYCLICLEYQYDNQYASIRHTYYCNQFACKHKFRTFSKDVSAQQ